MAMSMTPHRGNRCSGRSIARVPRMATGMTGTPPWAAATNAPMWNGRRPGGADQAALGEYHERLPGSDHGDDPVGIGHTVLALVAFDKLGAQSLEHESAEPFMLEHLPGGEAERGR